MTDTFISWRSHENIRPTELPNKEEYYLDLLNIEHSWSGRMDGNICNTFIMEAEQQLVNAIELFEMGYFDCAYYSLRSAVDISTTMVYLDDMPYDEQESHLNAWKSTADFPMQGQMIKQLSQRGNVFIDMKAKMPDFFAEAKRLSTELNKYVHKQGLRHFYISRNHPLNQNKPLDAFVHEFSEYLKKCIGVVAVMRLAIDPFPVVLMDKEILYRCYDSMTDPYGEKFVEKYIGAFIIEQYKHTTLYLETYDYLSTMEEKNEATFDVMKHQYIDSRKLDDIFMQLHLLSKYDVICVLLVAASEKTVKVYWGSGLGVYFTDRNTNRKSMSSSGLDFKHFSEAENLANQPYDEAFITVFYFYDIPFFVEHNELLTDIEIPQIENFVSTNYTNFADSVGVDYEENMH